MPAAEMHADELDVDTALVRRLVAEQFPRWAGLPVTEVPSAGTDTPCTGWATTWSYGCPGGPAGRGRWTRSSAGCRCWPRICR